MTRLAIALTAILLTFAGTAHAADPVIAVVGDAVCDPTLSTSVVTAQTCQHKAVSDLILRQNPARVLLPGDLQYESGSASAFQTAYNTTYGRFKNISCAVPGNHEYRAISGYRTYWGGITVSGAYNKDCPVPGAPNWTISGLDTSLYCYPVSCVNQRPWLQAQLAKAPTCEIAFFHIPLWSSGLGSLATNAGGYVFYRDMWGGHGELILTGHVHNYERFAPQDPWHNANAAGQRQITVGTGGKDLQQFRATPEKNSLVRRNQNFGALFITLHPSSYDIRFIATDNRILDQALGIPCRA